GGGDGSELARPRPGARGRGALRHRGVHQPHPRPPRLPRRHGQLRRRQGAAVPAQGAACGGGQPRRSVRPRTGRHAARWRARHRHQFGRRPGRRARHRRGPRRRRPAVRPGGRRRAPQPALAAARPLQRGQPARRGRRAARARARHRRHRHGAAATRADPRAHEPARRRRAPAGGGGLLAQARRPAAGAGVAEGTPRGPPGLRVRLRRRARHRQAPADGGDRRTRRRPGHCHRRQPAARGRRRDHRGHRRRLRRPRARGGRARPAPRDRARDRRGAARRHRAGGRQGPRDLPGSGRREAPVRRPRGGARSAGAMAPGGRAMMPLPLSRIAQWTGGRLHGVEAGPVADVLVDAVATDTRTLDASDARAALFVALRGERFDGHDHVAAAAEAGARAALEARPVDVALPQVVVADTERALAAFAAALQHTRATRVAAITGSNGKTSVKTLLLPILHRAAGGGPGGAYANPGNRNNEIGLPLAVLDAPEQARFAVYEMGAGKPGDIAYLPAVVRPDAALVNNIAPAHLERMGSLLGVADTKAAIYDALPAGGVAVINADDAFAPYFAERAHGRRLLRFGLEASADISARDIAPEGEGVRFTLVTPEGEVACTLALPGRHNVRNALAAASLALGLGASLEDIRAGLAEAR